MTYFDNAATTYPKPHAVLWEMQKAMIRYGANPGRGGHEMALAAAKAVYAARAALSDLFDLGAPERVIFTQNCTQALNMVIKGLARPGGHFICSNLEHNAVARPLEALRRRGVCNWDAAAVGGSDTETLSAFDACFRPETVAVVCTGASNVFGRVLPLEQLAQLAHSHGVPLVADLAQTAGLLPVSLQKSGIDFACCPGHKGLYGPMGTGVLLCNSDARLETLLEGGTGTLSMQLVQPEAYPERLESGTLNVPGIAGLAAGAAFVRRLGPETIFAHEMRLAKEIADGLSEMPRVHLYTDFHNRAQRFVPLISFNIAGMHSEEAGAALASHGFAVRAGLHCAPLAHRAYGTLDTGTVRVCPSVFSAEKDVKSLLNCIFQIAKRQGV